MSRQEQITRPNTPDSTRDDAAAETLEAVEIWKQRGCRQLGAIYCASQNGSSGARKKRACHGAKGSL